MYVTVFGHSHVSVTCTARIGDDAMDERLVVTCTSPDSLDATLRYAKK
jgi:hypothetical protein